MDLDYDPKEYKTISALGLKADAVQGIVEHLISVFGVLDLGGDIVHPGAFTKTLDERAGNIRVLDCHQRRSVLNVIGVPLALKEIGRAELPPKVREKYPEATGGLWAKTQFLMDTPEGKGAFQRIASGAVSEFSFGYDTLDSDDSEIKVDGEDVTVRNLRTLRLWEYSPVMFGMNPATAVTGVKDDADKGPKDDEGDEGKPAPDVTENTIRVRVRDPGKFQKGSFRTINIGSEDNGIQAVIGRLKGETTTTIQSYIFDKSKWTPKRAMAWVKEHGKSRAVCFVQVKDALRRMYDPTGLRYVIKELLDETLTVEVVESGRHFKVPYTFFDDGVVEFASRKDWIPGRWTFAERKVEDEGGSGESDNGSKQLLLEIELEQALMEIELVTTEAGPS